MRLAAGHRWAAAAIFATVVTLAQILTGLLLDARVSAAELLIEFAVFLGVGFLAAKMNRDQCEAWDRRVAEGPPPE